MINLSSLLVATIKLIGRPLIWIALFFWAKKSGKDEQKSEQVKAQNDALQTRIDIQDQLNAMSDDDRRRMLDQWASGVRRVVPDKADKP